MKARKTRIIHDPDYIETLQAAKRATDKVIFALGMLVIVSAILFLVYVYG